MKTFLSWDTVQYSTVLYSLEILQIMFRETILFKIIKCINHTHIELQLTRENVEVHHYQNHKSACKHSLVKNSLNENTSIFNT